MLLVQVQHRGPAVPRSRADLSRGNLDLVALVTSSHCPNQFSKAGFTLRPPHCAELTLLLPRYLVIAPVPDFIQIDRLPILYDPFAQIGQNLRPPYLFPGEGSLHHRAGVGTLTIEDVGMSRQLIW